MQNKKIVAVLLIACVSLVVTGCQKPDIAKMMEPPQRPAALDKLDQFLGCWEGSTECFITGAEEPMISKGSSNVRWAANRWLLVEEFTATFGEDEGQMEGLGVWMWNPKEENFSLFWYHDGGSMSKGTAVYDEKENCWRFKAKGSNPFTGMKTYGTGTSKFVDENTQEWNWVEWNRARTHKIMEMKGTTKRQ